jgi:hypothetical protein
MGSQEEKIELTISTTKEDAWWVVYHLNRYAGSVPQGEAFEAHAFGNALRSALSTPTKRAAKTDETGLI